MVLTVLEEVCLIIAAIYLYNQARDRYKLKKSGLVSPQNSPWQHLLHCGDETNFLAITGFNYVAFRSLKTLLVQHGKIPDPGRAGRPFTLDADGRLGIMLFYLSSKMPIKHLCMIFGCSPTIAERCIDNSLEYLIEILSNHPTSKVSFPTVDEMIHFATLIYQRDGVVRDVIGFLDGLSIPVCCSSDELEQSAYYNGYHHDTMVNNVLFFTPDGKISYAAINYPGSWHDATVSSRFIQKVIRCIGDFKICVDQGFPRKGDLLEVFVGPINVRTRNQLATPLRGLMLDRHNRYVSLRQASEWGMRALQGSFSRLKARLTSHKSRRHAIIMCCVLLHNWRTEYVGLNQIATVFNPEYLKVINIEGYDRIARYYAR